MNRSTNPRRSLMCTSLADADDLETGKTTEEEIRAKQSATRTKTAQKDSETRAKMFAGPVTTQANGSPPPSTPPNPQKIKKIKARVRRRKRREKENGL